MGGKSAAGMQHQRRATLAETLFGRALGAGLFGFHRGKIASQRSAKLEAQILAGARQKPKDGSTHRSTGKLAAGLGTNHTRVARVLAKAGLQPRRLRRYMASDDQTLKPRLLTSSVCKALASIRLKTISES